MRPGARMPFPDVAEREGRLFHMNGRTLYLAK